jgi:hypothetical protein
MLVMTYLCRIRTNVFFLSGPASKLMVADHGTSFY